MKLKVITGVFIGIFVLFVIYFLVVGVFLYNPHQKPTPGSLHAKIQAIKEGVFSSKPAIVHN